MMACDHVKVSTPGKLMILGEHAVLHGRRSLVCAINRRITMTVKFCPGQTISIRSALGQFEGSIVDLSGIREFRFLYSVITQYKEIKDTGMDIIIESGFSDTIGFGSSAAVTVALAGAIRYLLDDSVELDSIFGDSLSVIKHVQTKGSGADIAASVYGGFLCYRANPLAIEKIEWDKPITVVNSGNKVPTTDVIQMVDKSYASFPELYDSIFDLMDKSCAEAIHAVKNKQWDRFGELLTLNHGLMEGMGLSNQKLNEIVYMLRQRTGICGAKISGSGLGDCVIGIGSVNGNNIPCESLLINIAEKGFSIE